MSHRSPRDTPLTHSQLQIWIGQKRHPESPLYNMAFTFVFEAGLDRLRFQEAWRSVVEATDVLRTSVREDAAGGPPCVARGDGVRTEWLDLSTHEDPLVEFRRWARTRSAHPLRLSGPLLDSVLVDLGSDLTGWYLNQHHLLADAWSTVLLYRQVAAEYAARAHADRPAPLFDYHATATALRSKADRPSQARSAALEHWATRRARAASTVLYGQPASAVGTASTRLTVDLDPKRSQALDHLCTEDGFVSLSHDMSRFAIFATLLTTWLFRLGAGPSIAFDAPVTGRSTPESKRSLGLFIEMFPFAVTLSPGDTFRSLGATCLAEAERFLRHAFPGMSAPSAGAANPVVLNFFPGAFGPFAGIATEVEWVHPGHGDSVHAVRLQVHDFGGAERYTLHFDFNEGTLPDYLRRRSLEHFARVVGACLDDPDQPVASIDLRTDDERRRWLAFNATDTARVPTDSVSRRFEAQALATPDRVALRQGAREVSFGQLRTAVDALAALLIDRGVTVGARVAVFGSRSIDAVVALLATLRAGAAYVPVDPRYPPARVEQILSDSGARLVLRGADASPPSQAGLSSLAVRDGVEAGRELTLDRAGPGLDDLAYLIYTSGSTGRPKGVLIEHRGLADYVDWAVRQYARGDRLSYPLFTSLAFDLTVTSLFLPLVTGGTLVIYPEPEGAVDSALMDVVRANAVDFIKLTPSHLSLLRRLDLSGSRIRRMVVGGEDFKTELAAAITDQLGEDLEIYNEYGPTEAVVGCVVHRYDRAADTDLRVPIGRPADHVRVEVLNDAASPVPDGVAGELWVSRPGLARGYHGLDDLTDERFIADVHRPGTRRYRTGDLVRLTEGGTLEYLGRIDRQLKISGVRVEPAEVEAVLLAHPAIAQCAVVPRRQDDTARPVSQHVDTCTRCGLPSTYPAASFDDAGVCRVCRVYDSVKPYAQAYFRTMDDLRRLFEESARQHHPTYDCLMLLSGGKDSTYALCRLVDMGLSVYAFTLDNGFISDGAKANMRRVTQKLGVRLEMATTPAMHAIFRDSLRRFSNVCQGCFKTIYTLSMNRARELGIPVIVTGLSRGQLFETRLTEEMFREGRYNPNEVDAAVLAARKAYHRVDDEVARSLDVTIFEDDRVFDEIQFVDFYRYCDAVLEDVLSYLNRTVPWVRPADTGRSSNCLINDVGIYIHTKERGYHNYALPYSWDVRLGHKDRETALEELDDQLDLGRVRQILAEIGYNENRLILDRERTLAAFYVVAPAAGRDISEAEIRAWLAERLPSALVPSTLTRLEAIPLTANGKVDDDALPWVEHAGAHDVYTPPDGPVEEYLVNAWEVLLPVERVGAGDNFFELGGTSLRAMEMMIQLCQQFDITLPLESVFDHPTVKALAGVAEQRILDDAAALTDP